MNAPDREGSFRAEITEFGIKQFDSGAVGVSIRARLTEWYSITEAKWYPWNDYETEAEGTIFIVKKDNTVNQLGADSLIKYAGWDGNIESITNGTWQPTPCQVAIKREEYKQQAQMRIAFINDWHRTPGGMSNVSPEDAKAMQVRFGAQFRALVGNAQRNNMPATGRPATPPPAPAGRPQTQSTTAPPQAEDPVSNNVPF